MTLYLHGLGHFHPENEITNDFLTELDIGTDSAWIMERVGIRSRRTVLPLDYIRETKNTDLARASEVALYSNAETGKRAAAMALQRAGIEAGDVGLVIAGSCTPWTMSPADACNIASELGIEAPAIDINSACTSLHSALYMLSIARPEALPEWVLVVSPEALTRSVDYRDRAGAVLWGDCTVAAVLSTTVPGRIQVLGNRLHSSPAGHQKVVVDRFGHFHQEGRTVQMFAIKKTIRLLRELQHEQASADRELHFIGHQANLLMLQQVCEQCSIDDDHHHCNVVDYGNTASSGSPSVVSMRWDDWTDRDDIAVVGVGAGLTWSSYLLRFGASS